MDSSGTSGWDQRSVIDTSVSHSARVWNYWLGGKDNYPIDREVGDQFATALPNIVDVARAQRAFLVRTVRYLAAPKASPTTSTPTCVNPRWSCGKPPGRWTSPSPSR